MNRRIIAIVASALVAAVGAFVIVAYVQDADERAQAGETMVEVLVVDKAVDQGTGVDELGESVKLVSVPARSQATGSVSTLSRLEGRVTAVDLVPGEQLLSTRMITPAELTAEGEIDVPAGLLTATLSLSPERAVGGSLVPGDLVAVFASFEPFTLGGVEPSDVPDVRIEGGAINSGLDKTPNTTAIILNKVLVTNVQVERLPRATSDEDADTPAPGYQPELAPTGNLLITLASDAPSLERLIFTAEHGTVWLANQPLEAVVVDEIDIQTRGTVYR